MKDKNESSNEGISDQVGETAGEIKKAIGYAKIIAKGAGAKMPGAAGYLAKGLGVVEVAIKDKNPKRGLVEKIGCGGAQVVAEGAATGFLAAPYVIRGAVIGGIRGPMGAGLGALGAYVGAQPFIKPAAKELGRVAKQNCHAGFDLARAKKEQKSTAQLIIADKHARTKAMNAHPPSQQHWIGRASPYGFNHFNSSTNSNFNSFNGFTNSSSTFNNYKPPQFISPFSARQTVDKILKEKGYREGINSLSPLEQLSVISRADTAISFLKSQMSIGFSSLCNLGSFSSTLAMTNLISSYNSYNIDSVVASALESTGVIGGVASEVALITDLVNSEAHASAQEYFFCFPKELDFIEDSFIKQVAYELNEAYFTHKTLPFFSLHFNNKGFLYPVIHPAYENTLIGQVIAFLDYWMKGFLNGGIFDLDFLQKWHELKSCDEDYLRENLVNLKHYCKSQATDLGYVSLRELECRFGKPPSNSAYSQPYMLSFRIIAHLDKIKRHENILVPSPTFKVEYSLELMPDYKEYLERYLQEHGAYPKDYQNIRSCYILFAEEIKEKMPKLPFCRDYFQLLGVINTYCYAFVTFEKMGKRPLVAEGMNTKFSVPNAFPPIPVRYFKSYAISYTLTQLFASLTSTDLEKMDEDFHAIMTNSEVDALSQPIKDAIKELLSAHIYQELIKQLDKKECSELNEEELEKFCTAITESLSQYAEEIGAARHKSVMHLVPFETSMNKKALSRLPLTLKLKQVEKELEEHKERTSKQWNAATSLSLEEAMAEIPDIYHDDLREEFSKIASHVEKMRATLLQTELDYENIKKRQESSLKAFQELCISLQGSIDKGITDETLRAKFETLLQTQKTNVAEAEAALDKLPAQKAQAIAACDNATTEEDKIRLIKNSALVFLEKGLRSKLNRLITIRQEIEHGATYLKRIKHEEEFFNKYTHAFIGFTGKELAQKTGDNFQIIGGCSLSLPNLKTISLDNGHAFKEALETALDKSTLFTFNEVEYKVISLPVVDVQLSLQDTASKSQQALLHVITKEVEVSALELSVFEESLDLNGATFMHYAAASLDAQTFKQLPLSATADAFGNTPLHFAALSGNSEVIPLLIAQNPSLLEAKNNTGATALFLAIQYNQFDCVKALIDLKANANTQLPNGLFPLYVALQKNNEDLALYLLDAVPTLEINERLDSEMTALHLAIDAHAFTVATKLLQKGGVATIKRKADGFSALHCAVKSGALALVHLMKQQGMDFTITLESGKTLLHVAAQFGQLDLLKELMAYGLSVDAKSTDGNTALMLAITSGQQECAEFLAECAAINTVNNQQESASLLALQYGMPCVGDSLLARGESPELIDVKGHDYGYHLIRQGEDLRFFQAIDSSQLALERQYLGKNALELALEFGRFSLVFELESKGLIITKGNTVLESAVIADEIGYMREHIEETASWKHLAYLSAKHASIRCLHWFLTRLTKDEMADLHLLKASLDRMNTEGIELILDKTQDLNAVLDSQGNSALHLAIKTGSPDVVKCLMSRGADFKLRNKANHTPFHTALILEDDYLLKRLFKLTKPYAKEWPDDLWAYPTTNQALVKTLKEYQKLVTQNINLTHTLQQGKSPWPEILLDEDLKSGLTKLKHHFKKSNYEEAFYLLEENPNWHTLFKSQQGSGLLRLLFRHLKKPSLSLESENYLPGSMPEDKLLNVLKSNGVNPSLYKDDDNVLWAMKGIKNDVLTYRLEVLSRHFPESLAVLALDEITPNRRFIQYALKLDEVYLFETLEKLCRETGLSSLFGLHEAVLANNYELVQRMLKHYPVDSINTKGETPLMQAASINNEKMMALLLSYGAELETQDRIGQTALHHALLNKAQMTSLNLLTQMSQKNIADRFGKTPLMIAASSGLLMVVRYLCKEANFANSFDNQGYNALHHAALNGQEETARYLIEHGFAVDVIESPKSIKKSAKNLKRTPLHLAALKGHTSTVQTLLTLHANPEQENSRGETFIDYAIRSKNERLLELVHLHPAYYKEEKQSQLLFTGATANRADSVSELILNGHTLNAQDKSGFSALHKAAINNSGDVALLLLSGEDLILDTTCQFGYTPLHYAAVYGHVWLIELLVNAGANLDALTNKHQTPLSLACKEGHSGAVVALLHFGANITLLNKKGLTAGQVALINGHITCAQHVQAAGDKSINALIKMQLSGKMEVKVAQAQAKLSTAKPLSTVLIRQGLFSNQPQETQELTQEGQLRC